MTLRGWSYDVTRWRGPQPERNDPLDMIEQALNLYRQRISAAQLDKWPEVFTVHYAGNRKLGELSAKVPSMVGPAEPAYWLLIPLAMSIEVTTSVCIFDAYTSVDLDVLSADRVLYAVEIHDAGFSMSTTQYVIGYSVLEGGIRVYDAPKPSTFFVPKLNEVIGALLDHRQKGAVWSFEEAVAAAVEGNK